MATDAALLPVEDPAFVVGSPEWNRMNERRAELIHRKNREGLTPAEYEEYERLQRLSRDAVSRDLVKPTNLSAELEGIERRLNPQQSLLPIIEQAIARGASPDTLSKFLDLHERLELARAQEEFGRALAAFQAECPPIYKRRKSQGAKFSFAFASYDDIDVVVRPLLAKHRIAVSFDSTHTVEDRVTRINVTVTIRVGAYKEDRKFGCPVPTDLNASQPQQYGAALSYAKRYALCAALNIVVTDEDTDAAGLVDTISATQMIELEGLIRETKTDVGRLLTWAQAETLDRIPRKNFEKVKAELVRKKGTKT